MTAAIPPYTCKASILGMDRDVTVNVAPGSNQVTVRIDTALYPVTIKFQADDLALIAQRLETGADLARFG